ncbi:MAG: hypothetical protein IT427_09740 [Pirellulales bacterium]|nr:hypothetical protein [Pirellulales bacterium]
MKTALCCVGLSLLAFAGCRSSSRINQQLLERELRLQEDCIWKLKWQIEDQQRALDDARAQAETYRKEADAVRGKAASGPDLAPPSSILAPAEGGGRDTEAPRLPPAPSVAEPLIERGTEIAPPTISPPPGTRGSHRGNPLRPRSEKHEPKLVQAGATSSASRAKRLVDSPDPPERLNPDLTIDRIVLNEKLSGGLNLDGKMGDELLGVAIEQRDAQDARMIAPGDVSIVVVDPALDGQAAKIARWDFDADEVAKHVRRNRDGAALQFELPWPRQPEHNDLRLFVRFTTYDGRKLEANLPIEVQPADRGGWKQSQVSLAAHEQEPATPSDAETDVPQNPEDRPMSESPPARRQPKWSPDR